MNVSYCVRRKLFDMRTNVRPVLSALRFSSSIFPRTVCVASKRETKSSSPLAATPALLLSVVRPGYFAARSAASFRRTRTFATCAFASSTCAASPVCTNASVSRTRFRDCRSTSAAIRTLGTYCSESDVASPLRSESLPLLITPTTAKMARSTPNPAASFIPILRFLIARFLPRFGCVRGPLPIVTVSAHSHKNMILSGVFMLISVRLPLIDDRAEPGRD